MQSYLQIKDMPHLHSSQKEADTKLLLRALDATASDAIRIRIRSPDTDVFVLSLRRYLELCEDTAFVTRVVEWEISTESFHYDQ